MRLAPGTGDAGEIPLAAGSNPFSAILTPFGEGFTREFGSTVSNSVPRSEQTMCANLEMASQGGRLAQFRAS